MEHVITLDVFCDYTSADGVEICVKRVFAQCAERRVSQTFWVILSSF
jgi:hypothetical protein